MRATAVVGFLATFMLGSPVVAQTSSLPTGLEVALEADRLDTGFGDQVAELRMVLRNRNGDESSRRMRNNTLRSTAMVIRR